MRSREPVPVVAARTEQAKERSQVAPAGRLAELAVDEALRHGDHLGAGVDGHG